MLLFFFLSQTNWKPKAKYKTKSKQKSKSKQKTHWHKGRQETDKWGQTRNRQMRSLQETFQQSQKHPLCCPTETVEEETALPQPCRPFSFKPSFHFPITFQSTMPTSTSVLFWAVMHQRFCNSIPTQQATPTCNCKPPIFIHMLQPTDTVQELWSLLILVRAWARARDKN